MEISIIYLNQIVMEMFKASMDMITIVFKISSSRCCGEKYQPLTIDMTKDK